jgi:hypothetical protein
MVRVRCVFENKALRAGMLAHQMPMLISIMDHVFMGTEAWKGSRDYPTLIRLASSQKKGEWIRGGTNHGEYAHGV